MKRGHNCNSIKHSGDDCPKLTSSQAHKLTSSKKGQVTIFVIIAIVIVVLGVIIYMFRPDITSVVSSSEENPKEYFRNCIINELEANTQIIANQGAAFEPSHYYLYEDEMIDYLCFTPNYYEFCQVEKPMLVSHMEREIKDSLESTYTDCFNSLTTDYQEKGYTVNLQRKDFKIQLVPSGILLGTNTSASFTKGEDIERYDDFNIAMASGMYGLVSIAYNLMDLETKLGDADVNIYMDLSNDYMLYKIKRTDGTKIYKIRDTDTDETFQFASRSLVVPAGYGSTVA